MTSLLQQQNGPAWAARGHALRQLGAVPLYRDNQSTERGAPAYSRVDAPDGAVHTHYERAQRFQVYYESVRVNDAGKASGAPLLDSDDRAAARFAARLPQGASVLDMGCNTGRNLERLAEFGCAHLRGLDLSADSIDAAKQRLASLDHDVRVGSVSEPLPQSLVGAHDGAVFTAVAQHLDPEALERAFANLAGALAPGGFAWVSIKDIPTRAQLSSMDLDAWRDLAFTTERALADLDAQPSAGLAAHRQALKARAAGEATVCHAVMWDDDYYLDPATGQPATLEASERSFPSPGSHNRAFNFFPLPHIESLCRDNGLRVIGRRLYLDAKQPYGAVHWDLTLQKG